MSGFGSSSFGEVAFGDTGSILGGILLDLAASLHGADVGVETDAVVVPGLRAGIATSDGIADLVHGALMDALIGEGEFSPDVLANLVARLNATGSVYLSAVLAGDLASRIRFSDTVLAAWRLLLADGLQGAGTAIANPRRFLAVVDALAAIGAAESTLSALSACVTALALEALLQQGYSAELADQGIVGDTAASIAKLLAPLVETIAGGDGITPTLRMSAITADDVTVSANFGTTLRMAEALESGVLLYAVLRIGETDYTGWALNAPLRAVSEHRAGSFDSFATFKGKHYAAGPGGLVRFTGTTRDDTAAGDKIEAWVRTALMDFGTTRFKRVPDAFLALTTDGRCLLKVRTRDARSGQFFEDWYEVKRTKQGDGTGRAEFGRALKSTWWQLELHNIDGAGLELDTLELRPLLLDRRT